MWKAKSESLPRSNGVPYKVYKACQSMQHLLWKLIKVAWRNEVVLEVWARPDGVYITKEELASLLYKFHPKSQQC